MTLDVRAFWLIGALATGSCGLLVLIVRKAYPNYLGRALAVFGAANICLSMNYVLRFERAWVDEFFFYVVGAALVTTCLSLRRWWVGYMPRLENQSRFWFFFRIDSPVSWIRCELWIRRSRMASATVGSPRCSCQFLTGIWLVTQVARLP